MNPSHFAIVELLLFFVIFPVTFKALMALEISRFFQRGAIWQIQITYIFLSIALAYMVSTALANLIRLAASIAG